MNIGHGIFFDAPSGGFGCLVQEKRSVKGETNHMPQNERRSIMYARERIISNSWSWAKAFFYLQDKGFAVRWG